MKNDKVPISSTDGLNDEKSSDRVRTLGEFKPTNTPLSAAEIAQRKDRGRKTHHVDEWSPRTTESVDEISPVLEGQSVENTSGSKR
jgi:hypothetical protein